MKLEIKEPFYNQGTAPHPEDAWFVESGTVPDRMIAGVWDGYSEPHSGTRPQRIINKMSSGEWLVQGCKANVSRIGPLTPNLRTLVREMNQCTREQLREAGFPIDDAGATPGTTFAIAWIDSKFVDIAQAGDCIVIVEFESGEVFVTPNQVRIHDKQLYSLMGWISRVVAAEKFPGLQFETLTSEQPREVRAEMWENFRPILAESRRERANRSIETGYGVMNGDRALDGLLLMRRFPIEQVVRVVVATDGLIPGDPRDSESDDEKGRKMLELIKKGGLSHLFEVCKALRTAQTGPTHTDGPEAAGIEIVRAG